MRSSELERLASGGVDEPPPSLLATALSIPPAVAGLLVEADSDFLSTPEVGDGSGDVAEPGDATSGVAEARGEMLAEVICRLSGGDEAADEARLRAATSSDEARGVCAAEAARMSSSFASAAAAPPPPSRADKPLRRAMSTLSASPGARLAMATAATRSAANKASK